MPLVIRKVKNKDCYRVKNRLTGRILSKCSTLLNAKKQVRLVNYLESKKKK